MDTWSDEHALRAWREGEWAAGSVLFERHFDALYRFFDRKTGGVVDDLVQRTFLACVEGRERIEGSVRAYLYGIARRVLLEHFRESTLGGAMDFEISSLRDLSPSPSSAVALAHARLLLAEALTRIPVELQLAIELHYFEGMSGPELARILDVPEGTVRSRLRRALEHLEAELASVDREGASSDGSADDVARWLSNLG